AGENHLSVNLRPRPSYFTPLIVALFVAHQQKRRHFRVGFFCALARGTAYRFGFRLMKLASVAGPSPHLASAFPPFTPWLDARMIVIDERCLQHFDAVQDTCASIIRKKDYLFDDFRNVQFLICVLIKKPSFSFI
ncbi:MAG: hypothetical protein P4L61_04490, partial [Candidatus Pacebacteria bacterium]|nr:hypothetical protein [Candidatus Paceibacterota bacterium]